MQRNKSALLYLTCYSKARTLERRSRVTRDTSIRLFLKPGQSPRNAMNQDPRHFAAELEELKTRLLTMGGLAEERLHAAMRALVDRQHDVLADVTSGDSRIDELQIEIDDRCFKLIALYQPVAVDLRTIVSALKINDDWSVSETSSSISARPRNDIFCIRRSNP